MGEILSHSEIASLEIEIDEICRAMEVNEPKVEVYEHLLKLEQIVSKSLHLLQRSRLKILH